jgi:hypothetical protein
MLVVLYIGMYLYVASVGMLRAFMLLADYKLSSTL